MAARPRRRGESVTDAEAACCGGNRPSILPTAPPRRAPKAPVSNRTSNGHRRAGKQIPNKNCVCVGEPPGILDSRDQASGLGQAGSSKLDRIPGGMMFEGLDHVGSKRGTTEANVSNDRPRLTRVPSGGKSAIAFHCYMLGNWWAQSLQAETGSLTPREARRYLQWQPRSAGEIRFRSHTFTGMAINEGRSGVHLLSPTARVQPCKDMFRRAVVCVSRPRSAMRIRLRSGQR